MVVRGIERLSLCTCKALVLAVRIASKTHEARDLEAVLKSRTAIGLAIGVIMRQQRCPQDDAFTILSQAASNRKQKLRTVATELVESLAGTGFRARFEK